MPVPRDIEIYGKLIHPDFPDPKKILPLYNLVFGGERYDMPMEQALAEYYKRKWELYTPTEQRGIVAAWLWWILKYRCRVPSTVLEEIDFLEEVDPDLTIEENIERLARRHPKLVKYLERAEARAIARTIKMREVERFKKLEEEWRTKYMLPPEHEVQEEVERIAEELVNLPPEERIERFLEILEPEVGWGGILSIPIEKLRAMAEELKAKAEELPRMSVEDVIALLEKYADELKRPELERLKIGLAYAIKLLARKVLSVRRLSEELRRLKAELEKLKLELKKLKEERARLPFYVVREIPKPAPPKPAPPKPAPPPRAPPKPAPPPPPPKPKVTVVAGVREVKTMPPKHEMVYIPEIQGKIVPERFEVWKHWTGKYYIVDKETGKIYEADSEEAVKAFLEKYLKAVRKEVVVRYRVPGEMRKYVEVKSPLVLSKTGRPLMPPDFAVEGIPAEWLPVDADRTLWIPIPNDLRDKIWINPETGDYYMIVEERGRKWLGWMDLPPEAVKIMLEKSLEHNVYVMKRYKAELVSRGFSYLYYRDPRTGRTFMVRIPTDILMKS